MRVLDSAAYVQMATVDPDGKPYCVPLSVAREGEKLYFHSAQEGHKIDNLRRESRVCLSCVGDVSVVPGEFSLYYESVVLRGRARELDLRDEKIHALKLICQRFTPDHMSAFDTAIEKGLDITSVWCIEIEEICGKGRSRGE